MKKIFAVVCLFVVSLMLCACSGEETILIVTDLETMSIRAVRGRKVDKEAPPDHEISKKIYSITGNRAYLKETDAEPLENVEASSSGKEWHQTVRVPRGTKELYVEPVIVGRRVDIDDVIIDLLDEKSWENYDFKVKEVTQSETDNRDVITVTISNEKDELTKLGNCQLSVDYIKNEKAKNQKSEKFEGCSELSFEIVKRPYGYETLELVIDTILIEGAPSPMQKVIIE
ncbi:MAG: hypothetical protein IJN84_08120 [Clostridia bacterium]|nr:hypothetical protein [Clostridia bacterium]